MVYGKLLKALEPRAYEEWFAKQLRGVLERRLAPTYERGYEYENYIESAVFDAFYGGKLKAGSEMGLDPTIKRKDLILIDGISDDFLEDMEEILRDLHVDPAPDIARYEKRIRPLAEMAVWTSYNEGKLEFLKERQERFVHLRVMPDACENCVDLEGTYPIENVPHPPFHINCRCELEYAGSPA